MTYEYFCKNCNSSWEAEQRITEDALKNCPHCNTDNAQRLINGGKTFTLIGGGWAADNYSKNNSK